MDKLRSWRKIFAKIAFISNYNVSVAIKKGPMAGLEHQNKTFYKFSWFHSFQLIPKKEHKIVFFENDDASRREKASFE